MRLEELLKYDDIVIQCHDNPDADALASGYAVYWYLTAMGKSPKFIYRGSRKITKSNLMIMISELNIPVSYEPDFDREVELRPDAGDEQGAHRAEEHRADRRRDHVPPGRHPG